MRPSDTQRRLGVAEDGDADGSWSAPKSRRESEKPILGSNYTRASGYPDAAARAACAMAVRSRTSSDLSGQRSQKERLLQKVASEVWNTLSLARFMLQVAERHRHNVRPWNSSGCIFRG